MAASRGNKVPTDLQPMLATLVHEPVDGTEWMFEVKWDGYRCLAFLDGKTVELKSRNDKSFNKKFYPLVDAFSQLRLKAVIDGEIVVVNEEGISDFGALQNWRSESDGHLLFYAFDILWLNGKNLCDRPLRSRKDILRNTLRQHELIRFSEAFENAGAEMLRTAKALQLEGIIAKRSDSLYRPGLRTTDWLKIKVNKRHEVVIGGYTKNENSVKPFSSLLVGVYRNGTLEYTGKIGTGFSVQTQHDLINAFKPLLRKRCPFSEEPDINKPSRFRPNPPRAQAFWLKPMLVCEVSYTELTEDGIMRHPSFEGLRTDKTAEQVTDEAAISGTRKKETTKAIKAPAKKARASFLNPHEDTQVKVVKGNTIRFNNLGKIFWPKEQITKRDLINYYYQIAPFMVPHLKDRPQSLNRFPNGINGKSFYQKDVTGKAPSWVDTYLYHSDTDGRDKHFLVCTDEAALLYMASMGCIEINPWNSTVKMPDHPTWCIIDLDPGAKTKFSQVVEAARVTYEVLGELNAPSYCKTSGSSGLHIYIPLGGKYSYEECKEFARIIAKKVHARIPRFTSIERMVKNREGKLYVDFLQNRPQATVASVYSLRPKPGATVSMPLQWEELNADLKMTDFTIFNAVERARKYGDLFSPVLGKGIDLYRILDQNNIKLPL